MEAERNSAYFFSLEKNKYLAKTCTTLITDSGHIIKDPTRILDEQKLFYEKMYKKNPKIKFTTRNCTDIRLTNFQKQALDMPLEFDELVQSLRQMKNGKCPGMDGISVDFYKCFFHVIGQDLFEAIQEAIETGHLHSSALLGVINLIPKSGKDTRRLKNLRPISLLNVDFKIFEKALANRIKSVIDTLASEDQKGFLKQRRIATNIRRVLDLLKHADDEKIEAIILSIDFIKCFDLISHEAVFKTLEFFNFGSAFIDMVRITYRGCTSVVQNNGFFSRSINIEKGVRQGAPNSSFLFLLCAEVLAIMLKEQSAIQGIPVKEIIFLLGQYADDMDTLHEGYRRQYCILFPGNRKLWTTIWLQSQL